MRKRFPVFLRTVTLISALLAGCQARVEPAPEKPRAAPIVDAEAIRYPAGAAQLDMIQSRTVTLSPTPATDFLNARVVYDEDRTARIAVSYAGRIVALRAAPGDVVKAGQVLAEIDSPDVGTALADARKARADQTRKHQVVERARALVPSDAVSQRDWESLQADLAVARAETERTEQRLKNLDPRGMPAMGERIALRSPIAGIVAERTATPALEVSAGMAAPLFVVTDPRRLWLLIDLPEQSQGRLRRGDAVEVQSDAWPNQRFAAQVTRIGPTVDVNTRRVTAQATLANPDRKLLPEMFVRALAVRPTDATVRVPNSALLTRGLYTYVFVEGGAGEFRRRRVDLLAQGGEESTVHSGLASGERVVTRGAMLLDADLAARAGDTP